jgi:transcription-repair coupling factor (superfamily II helicase)
LPPPVENLLDYAVLKSMAERLQMSSIDRRGSEINMKFYPSTTLKPESLVRLVRGRPGARLEPSGVLTISLQPDGSGLAATVRNVLLQLETGG